MKSLFVILVGVLFALITQESFAQKKNVSVNGTLVELTSYVRENITPTGGASTEITMENLRKGGSLAIVQLRTKKVYVLAPAAGDTTFAARVSSYFGTTAFVKGTLHSRGGVSILTVEDIGKSIKK